MTVPLHRRPLRLLTALLLLVLLAAAVTAPVAAAVEPDTPAITGAIDWLREQQNDDGSFAAFGGEGDPGTTADVVFALASADVDPASVNTTNGASPLDYLAAQAPTVAADPGLAGKVVLALLAAGADPRNAGGTDLIAAIANGFDAETGWYGMGTGNHAYALLALAAAGEEANPQAIDTLLAAQIEDGSWSFTGEPLAGTGDSNSTALVIQALIAHGAGNEAVTKGIDYIRSLQDENGAVAYDMTEAPDLIGDANSTAVSIQAFIAAGEDPAGLVAALETFQNPGGAFFWRPDVADDSLLATVQAVPALLETTLVRAPASTNQAGIVVRKGDGSLVYATVEFSEPTIDGIELLTRSELDVSIAPFGGLGGAVCSIDDEGCPSDDCFCQSYSNPAFFWHYYILEDGDWVEHTAGASSRKLADGDIDGWSWTSGEHGLPSVTLDEIASGSVVPLATDDDTDEGQSTYLVFAGMAVLVLLIGGFGVMRSRSRAA